MAITSAQKKEIEDVINTLMNASSPRAKRQLAEMFLDLVDRDSWPEYYEVIPHPRCINGVKASVEKNKYKDPIDAYDDLQLVFLNALYYNEDGSQISKDATALKGILDAEWKQRSILPAPRASPPPTSPQKIHGLTIASSSSLDSIPTPSQPTGPTPSMRKIPSSQQSAPKSPERQHTPDIEIDVGGTPEPEGPIGDTARDGESDEIVRQLERSLPRWEGFGDFGWAEGLSEERQLEVVLAITSHKDANGTRLATALEAVPEETSIPDLSFNFPLSLSMIESRVRSKYYESSKAFDKELSQLFLKARRWYEPSSEAYGNVLVLQRLYHALTSYNPPAGPPYTSTINFASLRAGPGTARPLHTADTEGVPGVTTFRVSAKDRKFVDEVHFKGWSVRLADWLHLSNPDDPSKPIIAQVFKCYVSEDPSKKGQPGVTACWYYRPEQTYHPAHRQFWEQEVFKTSHFADHPLEDIIEKIACQFTARHIRGRPRPPFWYPSWPLYVCDSRYNDRERIFVKIKNWNSCVPEEVRKSTEFMPIYPFERSIFPRRFASPFVGSKAIRGTGGIGDVIEKGDGERIEGGGTGRKRLRKVPSGSGRGEHTDRVGPSKGLYVGPATGTTPPSSYQLQPPAQQVRPRSAQSRGTGDRSIIAAAGGVAALGGSVTMEKLPSETARYFDRDPETNEVLWFSSAPVDVARPVMPRHSLTYLHYLAKKRKKEDESAEAMEVDDAPTASKRVKVTPTATETMHKMMSTIKFPPPARCS